MRLDFQNPKGGQMVRASVMVLAFFSAPAFAQTDIADCKVSEVEIVATYHLDTKVMDVEMTRDGQTQSLKGLNYQKETRAQILADENLVGLMQFAHIPSDKVDSAAGFQITREDDGGLW